MPVNALIPIGGVDESPFVLVNGLNLWPWMFSVKESLLGDQRDYISNDSAVRIH